MLDIGAGDGAITDQLLRVGARVIAIELHPQRAIALRDRYAGRNVRVVRVDATKLRLPNQPFRVVSNPPFATTTTLLRTLLRPDSHLLRAELVVPRHVAARWSSGRGIDAHRWDDRFDAQAACYVPRRAFRPEPPSDAAVLSLITRRRARS